MRRVGSRVASLTWAVVAGVVRCSIVIAERSPDDNLVDLAARRDAPEARGLISISEESWPQAAGTSAMRSVISIEADNADSVRWYVRDVLGLDAGHPTWLDMERQLRATDERERWHAGWTGTA